MAKLSRRTLLGSAAAGTALVVSSRVPAIGFDTSAVAAECEALKRQIRGLHAKVYKLVRLELDLGTRKGKPGYRRYRKARYDAHRAEEELDRLTLGILARPVRTWDDVGVLAELARAHAEPSIGGGFALIEGSSADIRSLTMGTLLVAALKMGGGKATTLPVPTEQVA